MLFVPGSWLILATCGIPASLLATFVKTLVKLFSSHSCCGAGTAADTEYTTEIISSDLELHRLSTGRKVIYNHH